ncbi:protein cueball [Leptopilina boulardi]|uniref:protein cueball n=1 Tax=Leptopilina boulardi TaxID=63433 RepID=UPI0021F545FD|nr:protein cueball [Leptopilina boulardi]
MSSDLRFLASTVLFTVFFTFISGRTWDMAIAVGDGIDFLTKNGTLIGEIKIPEVKSLKGVAYDDITHTLFFSDNQNNNGSIFRINTLDKNIKPECLFKATNGTYVVGLTFDSISRTLFWLDAVKQIIMKMHIPLIKPPGNRENVVDLRGNRPRTIAIDSCNRYLYWGNTNTKSIERSNFDGSNKTTIIKENLYEPVAVTVDHTSGKLYWIDDEEGIHYKIERSDLDGLNRELIFHGEHQQPVHISVDFNRIYWIDWVYNAAWMINKNKKSGNIPIKFKSYHESSKDVYAVSVITRDNSGIINCSVFAEKKSQFPIANVTSLTSFNNLTASIEENDLNRINIIHCLNNGLYNEIEKSCYCKPGFKGTTCETSVCHNYCLKGICTISSKGLPTCQCHSTFNGLRCERNVCYNYCLNDGECTIKDGMPICDCKTFKGSRCELENFKNYSSSQRIIEPNVNNIEFNTFKCLGTNLTYEELSSINGVFNCDNAIPILSSVVVLLLILVVILFYYISKLRRRPRIRKRFIVSKEGTTPLTSRPQISNTQCEITIENCCNMNICETPCFEPKLRNTSQNSKKEEKKSLLINMDSNNC